MVQKRLVSMTVGAVSWLIYNRDDRSGNSQLCLGRTLG